jgi:hypothetical protein
MRILAIALVIAMAGLGSLSSPAASSEAAAQIVETYYKRLQKQAKGDASKLAKLEAVYRKYIDRVRKAEGESSRPIAQKASAEMRKVVE